MHAEHRGRTPKCPIVNHQVDYGFGKHVQHIRISVDKQNHIGECPLELEVIQEFAMTDKITLGVIKLNLSEYIEESEHHIKDHPPGRKRANSAGVSPTSAPESRPRDEKQDDAPEGIVRRYLMQESKVNSTLKMSILMVQVDGDRSFSAPPLKSAPTFGGIAGIIAHEQQAEEEVGRKYYGDATSSKGLLTCLAATPSLSTKPRDTSEIQDLYRRTLAASWCRLPDELPADECIEDIFSGGNGWKTQQEQQNNANMSTDSEGEGAGQGTLRPSDLRRLGQQHRHHHSQTHSHRRANSAASGASDKSASTVTGRAGGFGGGGGAKNPRLARDDRDSERSLSRSGSVNSLNAVLASDRSSSRGDIPSFKNQREKGEKEVREDMIAWRLPSGVAA